METVMQSIASVSSYRGTKVAICLVRSVSATCSSLLLLGGRGKLLLLGRRKGGGLGGLGLTRSTPWRESYTPSQPLAPPRYRGGLALGA